MYLQLRKWCGPCQKLLLLVCQDSIYLPAKHTSCSLNDLTTIHVETCWFDSLACRISTPLMENNSFRCIALFRLWCLKTLLQLWLQWHVDWWQHHINSSYLLVGTWVFLCCLESLEAANQKPWNVVHFGADKIHLFNSRITLSFIFWMQSNTTQPIRLDDISEKLEETWWELIMDAYNNTPQGTHAYNNEKFCCTVGWVLIA